VVQPSSSPVRLAGGYPMTKLGEVVGSVLAPLVGVLTVDDLVPSGSAEAVLALATGLGVA
jgi:hypothetical protein